MLQISTNCRRFLQPFHGSGPTESLCLVSQATMLRHPHVYHRNVRTVGRSMSC